MSNLTGIQLISQEREEQLTKHGRSIANDFKHNNQKQLQLGALILLTFDHEEAIDPTEVDPPDQVPEGWNAEIWLHCMCKGNKDRLIIAGALIAAELDRLNFDPTSTPEHRLLEALKDQLCDFDPDRPMLSDRVFSDLCEHHCVDEDTAMELMINSNLFYRREDGWDISIKAEEEAR